MSLQSILQDLQDSLLFLNIQYLIIFPLRPKSMKNRKYAASEPIIEETKEAGEKLGINDASISRAGRTLKKKVNSAEC